MKLLAFDFETAGGEIPIHGGKGKPKIRLDARKATPKLLSCATESGAGLFQPEEYHRLLPILGDPGIVKIGHNLAYDLGLIRAAVGHRFPVVNLFDTMIGYQLLIAGLYENSLKQSSLKAVVKDLLGIELDKELQRSNWSGVHTADQLAYALKDSEILIKLYPVVKEKLEEAGLARVAQIEFDCVPMTVEAMQTGLPLDVPGVRAKIAALTRSMKQIESRIKALAAAVGWQSPNKNKVLNLASSQHLKLLLQLVYGGDVADASGGTIKALLQQQPDKPLAAMLRDLKKYQMQQRSLRSWLKNRDNGRIYASYQQIGARTGRYASSGPNAQQIGRELRYLFKAGPGRSLVECDYSNIEMRLAAEISGEPYLLQMYKEGKDVHRATAAKVFNVAPEAVTPEQRKIAKVINFGALYGGGARYLLEQLPNLTKSDAYAYLDAFKAAYPGLQDYQHRCTHEGISYIVNSREYIVSKSLLGRRVYSPAWAPDGEGKTLHPRIRNRLINIPIQSTAVDLFKLASGLLYREFCKPEYADFQFLLSLHDSVLLECPAERAEECAELIDQSFMVAANEIFQDVPCKADVKIGSNWSFKAPESPSR